MTHGESAGAPGPSGRGRRWRAAAVAIAALTVVAACRRSDDAEAATPSATPPPAVIGPENIAIAATARLASGPTLSGTLTAERQAQVRAEVDGPVLEVKAEEGQRVRGGTLLARIDDTALRDAYLSARAAFRSAESSAQLAQRDAARNERLSQAGAIAERDVEQSRQSVASATAAAADARARLVSAEKQLAKTSVRAPLDGIVSERPISTGDVVQVGALLYTVVDPTSLRLEATVPAEQVSLLKPGTPVDFTVTGYGQRGFRGRVERVNPAVDPETRQVRLYVGIPNSGQTLVAGLFAQGRVATESREALALPVQAVDERGPQPMVLRLKGGRVERVPVTLGLRDDVAERVEVRSGVAPGDTVVFGTAQAMESGTVVRVRRDAP